MVDNPMKPYFDAGLSTMLKSSSLIAKIRSVSRRKIRSLSQAQTQQSQTNTASNRDQIDTRSLEDGIKLKRISIETVDQHNRKLNKSRDILHRQQFSQNLPVQANMRIYRSKESREDSSVLISKNRLKQSRSSV